MCYLNENTTECAKECQVPISLRTSKNNCVLKKMFTCISFFLISVLKWQKKKKKKKKTTMAILTQSQWMHSAKFQGVSVTFMYCSQNLQSPWGQFSLFYSLFLPPSLSFFFLSFFLFFLVSFLLSFLNLHEYSVKKPLGNLEVPV